MFKNGSMSMTDPTTATAAQNEERDGELILQTEE
jgi:hypothetical protein